MGEQMLAEAAKRLGAAWRFFPMATGEGGTTGRWVLMLALSAMIHSRWSIPSNIAAPTERGGYSSPRLSSAVSRHFGLDLCKNLA